MSGEGGGDQQRGKNNNGAKCETRLRRRRERSGGKRIRTRQTKTLEVVKEGSVRTFPPVRCVTMRDMSSLCSLHYNTERGTRYDPQFSQTTLSASQASARVGR